MLLPDMLLPRWILPIPIVPRIYPKKDCFCFANHPLDIQIPPEVWCLIGMFLGSEYLLRGCLDV